MRIADARQQGGHPTHPDHIFTYEVSVEHGEVILFHRTGSYPHEFCPEGYNLAQGILSIDGPPDDGLYTFHVQRNGTPSATFQAEGGREPDVLPSRRWQLPGRACPSRHQVLGQGDGTSSEYEPGRDVAGGRLHHLQAADWARVAG